MAIDNITILIEPARRPLNLIHEASLTPLREFYECDRLADELRQYTQANISVIEGFLHSAPEEGIILLLSSSNFEEGLNECPIELQKTLPKRVVLLAANRSDIFEILERHSLAAAIEKYPLFLWYSRQPHSGNLNGLHGLTSIAEELGAEILFESGRYCQMRLKSEDNLPLLLVKYLEVYTRKYL